MSKKIIKKFLSDGFAKISLFNKSEIKIIEKEIKIKLNKLLKDIAFKNLRYFHKLRINKKQHSTLLNPSTRYINLNKKIFKSKKFKGKIGNFLESYWGHKKYSIYWIGSLKKREIKKNKIGFRIVRPSKKKEGGIEHTDAYSKYLKSFVTIWIPIVGFKKNYTLRYAKKSHLCPHPKKMQIKQNKYNSKAISKKYLKKFNFVRPSLKIGQAMIHHPNILHGGSNNLGNYSRVSVEIRIFDLKNHSFKQIFDNKYYY